MDKGIALQFKQRLPANDVACRGPLCVCTSKRRWVNWR
jgi:hypothetical protein